ncbi:MAG: hypothetical protein K0R63_665 [Rickettsiales bacterium]|nr:hypothetical protein [Rickettsiales bacterium]
MAKDITAAKQVADDTLKALKDAGIKCNDQELKTHLESYLTICTIGAAPVGGKHFDGIRVFLKNCDNLSAIGLVLAGKLKEYAVNRILSQNINYAVGTTVGSILHKI